MPKLMPALLVAELDRRQLLEQQREVGDLDVGADHAGGLRSLEQPHVEFVGPLQA